MRSGARAMLIAAALSIAAGAAAWASEYRSKPGAPRAPAPRVGVEITAPPPPSQTTGEIGAIGGGAPPPRDLTAPGGGADYGFSPLREAEIIETTPLGGGPRLPWPNK